MTERTHGIVGAYGSMGQALQRLLKDAGPVVCVGEDWAEQDRAALWKCDVIWLAVPRDRVRDVLDKMDGPLQPSQLVIDICSVKRGIAKQLERTGSLHLSLHPVHGPNIAWNRQRWFLIGRRDQVSPRAEEVLAYLENRGVVFLESDSEDDHDFRMGIVLGSKEILTLVIDHLIDAYAADCKRPRPDIADLLEWSSPVANAVYGGYVHSVLSSEDWLRTELVEKPYGDVRCSARRALRELADNLPTLHLEDEFGKQRSRIEGALTNEWRAHIKEHINGWFEDREPMAARSRDLWPIFTESLTLRRFTERDRDALVTLLCDETVMRRVFAGGSLNETQTLAFIDSSFPSEGEQGLGLGVLCRSADERILGFAGLIPCKWPLEGQLEFGVVLDPETQHKGYGREIGRKLIEIGLEKLRLERLYALCHPENADSIRWLTKLGMESTELVIPNYHGTEPRKVFRIARRS